MGELIIEGVDVERGITYSGAGSYENYVMILEIFCKEIKEKLGLLEKYVEEKKVSLYTIHIHAVKSACASIGASEVSRLAETLEAVGKNEEFDILESCHKEFMEYAAKLLNDIQDAIKDKMGAVAHESFDDNEVILKLESLRAALNDYNLALIDELSDDLQLYTNCPKRGTSISEILHNAFITNYDKAVEHIDDIL